MTVAWHLALHIALWAAAFPVLGYCGAWLERAAHPALATATWPVWVVWLLMLAWAAWIYLRWMPRQDRLLTRVACLALYTAAMGAVAYAALGVAVVLVAMAFGV